MKKLLLVTFIFLIAIIAACTSANAPNGNTVSNSNSTTNIPPEFSNRPVTPSGNSTPGIPDPSTVNVNNMPKGTTPTPGIPDPKTIGKTPVPKGATPTPGIPPPEVIKKQLNQTLKNANVINQIPKTEKDVDRTIDQAIKSVRKKP